MILELAIAGVRVRIDSEASAVSRILEAAWAPSKSEIAERLDLDFRIESTGRFFVNGTLECDHVAPDQLARRVELRLMEGVMALLTGGAFLHAGGVVHEGRLFVLSGPSGAGKSSFVRELVKRGGAYLTDDLLVVSDGRVRGFARAVQFDPIPHDAPIPPHLIDCDFESYVIDDESGRFRVPLWRGVSAGLGEFHAGHGQVVLVALERGSQRLQALEPLRRTAEFHGAALTVGRPYDGSLDGGPAFLVAWQNPGLAVDALLGTLRGQTSPFIRR